MARKEDPKSKTARGFVFISLETIMTFVSRTHIVAVVKEFSVGLERRIRGVFSVLLRSLVLKNHIINIDGVRYCLSDERLESLVTLFSEYEKHIWEYLTPRPGDVFIDVGAHVGKYALRVAKIVGNQGLVVAVEPHPGNYRALRRGVDLNGYENVVAINAAVWAKNRKLKLYIHDAAVHHSTKVDLGLGFVEVDAKTVDQIVAELKLRRVDWIKIDAEDAEVEVALGLQQTAKRHNPKIIMEIQYKNLAKIEEIMQKYHYVVRPIPTEQNPRAKWGYFYCNARPKGDTDKINQPFSINAHYQ